MKTRNKRKILQLDLNNNIIAEFESITAASHQTGILDTAIGNVCAGWANSSGGFKWQYVQ
jgi:predicted  nucleic acid-binding Zn-ribbon protein